MKRLPWYPETKIDVWNWQLWLTFLRGHIPYTPDWMFWLDWGKANQN